MATNKRNKIKIASVYFEDQIENIDTIGEVKGVSRSQLLREGADLVVSNNKDIIKNKKSWVQKRN